MYVSRHGWRFRLVPIYTILASHTLPFLAFRHGSPALLTARRTSGASGFPALGDGRYRVGTKLDAGTGLFRDGLQCRTDLVSATCAGAATCCATGSEVGKPRLGASGAAGPSLHPPTAAPLYHHHHHHPSVDAFATSTTQSKPTPTRHLLDSNHTAFVMANINWRTINIDALDPDSPANFDLTSLTPAVTPISTADVQNTAQQIRQLLRGGDNQGALQGALENPPYGGDEKGKVRYRPMSLHIWTHMFSFVTAPRLPITRTSSHTLHNHSPRERERERLG